MVEKVILGKNKQKIRENDNNKKNQKLKVPKIAANYFFLQ